MKSKSRKNEGVAKGKLAFLSISEFWQLQQGLSAEQTGTVQKKLSPKVGLLSSLDSFSIWRRYFCYLA